MALPNLRQPTFFLLTIFTLLLSTSHSQQPLYKWCSFSDNANYTSNSTFETNLDTLLTNLSTTTPSASGFLTSTSGSVPNRATGLALCRGDTNSTTCGSCLSTATSDLPQLCPYNKDAVAWYDDCLLRYSYTTFVGDVNNGNRVFMHNSQNISTTGAARFNSSILSLLHGLQSYAANNATRPRAFAAGEMDIGGLGGYEKLYGLVQCTRDITAGDCFKCLDSIFMDLPSCCPNAIGGRVLALSCNFRYEVYPFFDWSTKLVLPTWAPVAPASAPAPVSSIHNNTSGVEPGKKQSSTVTALAIAIPLAAVLLLLIMVAFFFNRKAKIRRYDSMPQDTSLDESLLFDPAAIRRATNNFAAKVGEGGFGAVYKGVLPNGQEVAVKRVSGWSVQGVEQLKNEVQLLARLQHRNLVKLIGACLEGDEKLLVYEFIVNRSLDIFLFDPTRNEKLNWETRYKIITGIARGLQYLHEESQITVIHRDLKASNILLDTQMNPKIADFGTARLFTGDQTQSGTSTVVGTFGYMSPEYVTRGRFSKKSDIFSFGILVLEIITGRKCSEVVTSEESGYSTDLLSNVWEHWSSGSFSRTVDASLGGNYPRNVAQRCIHVALLCVQELASERPSMSSVVLMLSSFTVSMHIPMQPAFLSGYSKMGSIAQGTNSDSSSALSKQSNLKSEVVSLNDVSITEIHAR